VRLPSNLQAREAILEESREITNARQAVEWGMRSIQGAFGRLRLPLSINPKSRQRILIICFRLHQLRVRRVGINQIQSVYDPLWQNSEEQAIEQVSERFTNVNKGSRVSRFNVYADEDGVTRRMTRN
jgi:hypothetical protein